MLKGSLVRPRQRVHNCKGRCAQAQTQKSRLLACWQGGQGAEVLTSRRMRWTRHTAHGLNLARSMACRCMWVSRRRTDRRGPTAGPRGAGVARRRPALPRALRQRGRAGAAGRAQAARARRARRQRPALRRRGRLGRLGGRRPPACAEPRALCWASSARATAMKASAAGAGESGWVRPGC